MKTFFILLKLLLIGTAISIFIYSAVSSTQSVLLPMNVSLEVKEIPVTRDAQCSPHNHIMFIKMHKCGSSTLQPSMIPERLLPPGGKIDIFALHTRVNVKEQTKVLHKDTRWITVLREPASQFESFYNYFNLKKYFKKNLGDFKNIPVAINFRYVELHILIPTSSSTKKERKNERRKTNISLPRYRGLFGKNQMTFVMGYPDGISGEPLHRALGELERLFDQVLIYEHWDESLVLLRHLLCWSLHDVVAFKKNARGKRRKAAMDAALRRTLRELNYADVELYDHFLAKHRRQVLAFGVERMSEEVLSLKTLREDYSRRCAAKETAKRQAPEGEKNVTQAKGDADAMPESCYTLSLTEIPLIKAVRQKQIRMLRNTKEH